MIYVRHLRLRTITATRQFGADLQFKDGLNVVIAGNTSGKSTCLQAIIFGLGLERSLGPQLTIPLPYAMRERIHETKDAEYEAVLQAYVELEVENTLGISLLIRRDIVGGKDPKLLQTWIGARSADGRVSGTQRDFFVHDAGAAQREDGFHHFLAKFIGWDLPTVPRFDGSETPLYLEAIFPMLFVEQKRGWSTVQGPFPTFLKIQDVTRRVMEFLLDLDAGHIRRERAELRRAIASLQQKWEERRRVLDDNARRLGRVRGIPLTPTAEFAQSGEISIELLHDDKWLLARDLAAEYETRIQELEKQDIRKAEDIAPEVELRWQQTKAKVEQLTAILETLRTDLSAELQEHRAIAMRLQSLEADLKRNQDALKLKRLGSDLGKAASEQLCPTCHQTVAAELLPTVANAGMGLDENISYIKSQIDLYRASFASSTERRNECQSRYEATERELRTYQQELRALRQAMLQPAAAPSRVNIEEIVRRQAFVDQIRSLEEAASGLRDELQATAREWALKQDLLKRLPNDELTDDDKAKISALETSICRHLEMYGFKSFKPSEIHLSRDNFRPLVYARDEDDTVIEKEINFETSASDGIRLKWAYYLSLLSLSSAHRMNHAGLLVFDEPGQQQMQPESLYAFLGWSAEHVGKGHQVIVATSEPRQHLEKAIDKAPTNFLEFGGFILQPLN